MLAPAGGPEINGHGQRSAERKRRGSSNILESNCMPYALTHGHLKRKASLPHGFPDPVEQASKW